jgi:hypothetical protein
MGNTERGTFSGCRDWINPYVLFLFFLVLPPCLFAIPLLRFSGWHSRRTPVSAT